jgi:ribosomal protein S18 acetylase RimI-like enzyme
MASKHPPQAETGLDAAPTSTETADQARDSAPSALPRQFVDDDGRTVQFVAYRDAWYDSLVAMYDDFAPGDRAQGLPPVDEPVIETWLENVLDAGGVSVLAVHDDTVAGHVMLVDDDDAHELGVFVHQDYQDAGIGTTLLSAAFAHARRRGVRDVWLTVSSWNQRAIAVYDHLGFERDGPARHGVEMSKRL